MNKKIGTANFIASSYYGLVEGEEYILDIRECGVLAYNMKGTYITASRLDAFDNIRDFCKNEDGNCMACEHYDLCSQ